MSSRGPRDVVGGVLREKNWPNDFVIMAARFGRASPDPYLIWTRVRMCV